MTCFIDIDGSEAPRADYRIEQGVDFARSFQVKLNGVVQSLASWSGVLGQARRSQAQAEAVAFSVVFTIDYDENRVYWQIPAETTLALSVGETTQDEASIFWYDFLATISGRPVRIQQGKFVIHRDISRPA